MTTGKLKAIETGPSPPGTVVYIGRLPHGFYETELRGYFSQFGIVERLRVPRNKLTNAPKHYAFLQFADPMVAKIVVDTMHNYLLFGRLLQVKLYDSEKTKIEGFWKGANKCYLRKVIPKREVEKKRRDQQQKPSIKLEKQAKDEKRMKFIEQKFGVDPLKCQMTMKQLLEETEGYLNKA